MVKQTECIVVCCVHGVYSATIKGSANPMTIMTTAPHTTCRLFVLLSSIQFLFSFICFIIIFMLSFLRSLHSTVTHSTQRLKFRRQINNIQPTTKKNCINIEIRNYMESVHDCIVVTQQTRFVAVCRWICEKSMPWNEKNICELNENKKKKKKK